MGLFTYAVSLVKRNMILSEYCFKTHTYPIHTCWQTCTAVICQRGEVHILLSQFSASGRDRRKYVMLNYSCADIPTKCPQTTKYEPDSSYQTQPHIGAVKSQTSQAKVPRSIVFPKTPEDNHCGQGGILCIWNQAATSWVE